MIASFCTASDAAHFTTRLLADTDCQTMGLVERGYAALAQPGGTLSIALTGLMSIAVGIFGYRLLLGRGIALADAVGLTVKLGIVLVIATSWESWQALAYNGLARAPTQIAGDLLSGIGARDPIQSLENMLDGLTQAAVGYRMRAGIASPLVGGPAAAGAVLNLTSVFLTMSTVGILVAARVVLAVLLAIAPAMAGLILFNGTRGMAQGWIGAIASAAITPLFVLVLAAIEFAIMEPMLTRLLSEQAAGTYENASVMPLGLVTVVFLIATVFALRAGAQIARGVRLPRFLGQTVPAPIVTERHERLQSASAGAVPSSAQHVTRALESMARRDAPARASRPFTSARASSSARDVRVNVAAGASPSSVVVPLRSRSRRGATNLRRSRAASRRDA